jgi:pilus assembly protein CpaB
MITSGNYMSALDGGKQIVSVTIKDFANGISGKLMPGDIVMILNNAEAVGNRSTVYPELQYVKVLAVTTQTGVDMGGEKLSDDTELPATVTLLVNKAQAQLLTGLEKNGNIVFALMYRGDEDTANQFLQKQEEVFKASGF